MKYLSNIFTGVLSVFFITTFAYNNKVTRHQDKQELPPMETHKPNTNYQPAVKGQKRIPDVKTADSYLLMIFTNKMSKPLTVTPLPDGRLTMTEKSGTLRIVSTPAVHTLNQDVWLAEPGLRGGDKINLIKSDRNQRWNIITYGSEYSSEKSGEGIKRKGEMD